MKRTTLTLLFSTICFSLLSIAASFTESETRDLSDFDKVAVSTGINLELVPGNTHRAEIEADGIDMEDIVTKVKDGKLIVKVGVNNWWNWGRKKRTINVRLTYTVLEGISASSGARITSDEIVVSNKLKVKASSGARIDLEVEAKNIGTSASSGSDITLSGECDELKTSVSSGAQIESAELEANYVKASASSGAYVSVWAKETLDASASSGGRIKYEGNPSNIEKSKSSGGSIKKI